MPHILILPSFYHTEREPVKGVFFRAQARALALTGSKVGVCYYDDRDTHSMDRNTLRENHFQITCNEYEQDGFPTLTMQGWSSSPRRSRLGLELWVELNRRLVHRYIELYGRPDIIHAHNTLYGGYLAMRLATRLSIPYVITEHSSQFLKNELSPYQSAITCKTLSLAANVWAVSHTLGHSMEQHSAQVKVDMLPNFIDTPFFDRPKIAHPIEEFHIFSLANLNANKGFDTLLKAFAQAFAGDCTATLTIGGAGELQSSLRSLIMRLGIGSQVCMCGEMGREQVAQAMRHSDIFALASRVETFGVVFVEAMSAGLPVIATDCGGPSEFITKLCGVVVPIDSAEAMAEAMVTMRSNLSHYNSDQIKEYARDNFDSQILAKRLNCLYAEAINKYHLTETRL